MSGQAVSAAGAQWREIMDDKTFDNIARRLGGLRSRREALKTAGGVAAAVFTAVGLENSALAEEVVGIENHCKARRVTCEKPKECCGYRRKRKREIVCKPITGLGGGDRCCGQNKASCFADDDCCQLYECNQNTLQCQLIP
jgi:hypothetical protein